VFKGLPATVKEVFIDPGSFTSCYNEFKGSEDYLIYTGDPQPTETFDSYYGRAKNIKSREGTIKPLPPAWKDLGAVPVFRVGMCSPSRPVRDDDPDLAYLRLAAEGQAGTTGSIQGVAVQDARRPFSFSDFLPVARATITASNASRSWITTTATDGSYRIAELPPGKYTLSIANPDFGVGKFIRIDPNVEVVAGGCVVAGASFDASGTITGTVLNHDGQPASGVRIDLGVVNGDEKIKLIRGTWTYSDVSGGFMLQKVPVGRIVVGVNISSSPTSDLRFEPTYVSDATTATAARIFTLKPDDQVTGVLLRLPKPLPFGDLFVHVEWPDGSPATGGARAFARWNGLHAAFEHAAIDGNRVKLSLALGRTYEISADWLSNKFMLIDGEESQSVVFSQDGQSVTIRLKEPRPH
jgi:hypothetical protein